MFGPVRETRIQMEVYAVHQWPAIIAAPGRRSPGVESHPNVAVYDGIAGPERGRGFRVIDRQDVVRNRDSRGNLGVHERITGAASGGVLDVLEIERPAHPKVIDDPRAVDAAVTKNFYFVPTEFDAMLFYNTPVVCDLVVVEVVSFRLIGLARMAGIVVRVQVVEPPPHRRRLAHSRAIRHNGNGTG